MATNLTDSIMKELNKYSNEVKNELKVKSHEVAKKTAKKLKKTSPHKNRDYQKGWRAKKTKTGSVVHNATDYQLTHLLEHGHVNRDGTFTEPTPHIGEAEQEAVEEFLKEVEEAIKG
ncbi:HK97 gp10 family phage protein [Globicatella sulfidifaciens]